MALVSVTAAPTATSGPRRRRVRGRAARVLGVVAIAAVVMVLAAPGALAHTTLIGSSPAAGERLAYSPDEVVLTFGAPVSPSTVQVELRAADGTAVPLTPLLDGDEPVTIVAFDVPRLAHDVYGLSWQSVGADGHRVVGEVLFGVGVAVGDATAPESSGGVLPDVLDVAALLLRVGWYIAVALIAGIAVISRAGALAGRLAGGWLRAVALLAAGLAVGRAAVALATLIDVGAPFGEAILARGVWGQMATGLVVGVLGAGARPSAALALAVVGSTLAGHAVDRPDPVAAVAFGALHLGAAALWTGPLLVLLGVRRTAAWRDAPREERAAEVRSALRRLGPVAGWSLAVVGGSGLLLASRMWDALTGGVLIALVAKVGVVALVAVPLGIWHHRTRSAWDGVLPRTLRVEAAGLVAALALGGVLVGWDPGWSAGGGVDPAVAAILDGTAQDPSLCADLEVGRAACYRATLAGIMAADGPQEAIDAMVQAQAEDPYVAENCHQVAHDLGNDAAERIPDMAQALAVEGSACWSGYYHGFVEARLALVDDEALIASLPSFCDGAADPAYSFTHYNCLHGLGHGLMLRVDADLFEALPLCRALEEHWLVRSCASGAFMENVMAAQQGLDVPGVDAEDLLYPCTAVEADVAEDCYLMQTSTIIWRLGGDVEAAFTWCDQVPDPHAATCYRSMGRDISSIAALDAWGVIDRCGLGDPALAPMCIDGAAANAVYEQAGREAADALCAAVPEEWVAACTAARDQALETVARG